MTDNQSPDKKNSKSSFLENFSCLGFLAVLITATLAIFGGIGWFNANKNYSESVQTAQKLLSEACSEQSFAGDVSMIEKADGKLSEASKLLQPPKIPILETEIPTLDSQKGQSNLANIPQCQERLDTAKKDRKIDEGNLAAIEKLKKSFLDFSGALDVSNGYQSYSEQFNLLRIEFESVSKIPNIQTNSSMQSLRKVLESYEIALNAWRLCEESKCSRTDLGKELFLPDSSKITTDLADKYGVKIELQPSLVPQQGIKLKDALQAVWQRAKRDINTAK